MQSHEDSYLFNTGKGSPKVVFPGPKNVNRFPRPIISNRGHTCNSKRSGKCSCKERDSSLRWGTYRGYGNSTACIGSLSLPAYFVENESARNDMDIATYFQNKIVVIGVIG